MKILEIIRVQLNECLRSNTNIFYWIFYRIYYYIFFKKNINIHQKVTIKGIKNISIGNGLRIGMNPEGFVPRSEKTYLNIKGKLLVNGSWSIGRGCKIYIDKNGSLEVGNGGYVNSYSSFIIGDEVKIGSNCIISWNCQFLNEDTHKISYEGKKEKNKRILIGNNVWIGNNVKVYAGAVIPDNTVIASDTVVKNQFHQPSTLLAGIPAKVVKENIIWGR